MENSKYGKYFKKEPIWDGEFAPCISLKRSGGWEGLDFKLTWKCITEPHHLETDPHAHDFDQVLCFLGGNPLNVKDFQAEVEFSLGEEQEKHIIDSTTLVFIPKGMIHCPLYFRKVAKPVVFMNIALTAEYSRSIGPPPPPMIKKY